MIAPVMTHEASPSNWCLPVVTDVMILRGSSRISQSDNLPSRLVALECRRIEVVVDDRGPPASDDDVVLLVTTVLD